MLSFLDRFEGPAYALMRMLTGFLFLCHGAQKLFSFPAEAPAGLPAWITYGAGPIEFLGGLLVLLGLFTRPAAFLASGCMAVAYWLVHGSNALFPLNNGGELAALYCFVFLFIACRGGGRWCLDAR